jgi:hypothetical protein
MSLLPSSARKKGAFECVHLFTPCYTPYKERKENGLAWAHGMPTLLMKCTFVSKPQEAHIAF